MKTVKLLIAFSSTVRKSGCNCPNGTWSPACENPACLDWAGLNNKFAVPGFKERSSFKCQSVSSVQWISITVGRFWLQSNSTFMKGVRGGFYTVSTPPRQCDPLSPCLLKMSNMATYDWSSNTDLHLWFKCQESSPILKCTVVIRLSDSLVWSQEWVVAWMYLAAASPPSPHPAAMVTEEGRWRGESGPVAELFLPIRTLCTKALKQPPLWHDDNVQFHTASWRLTVY